MEPKNLKKAIILSVPNDFILQPNRITNAQYDYSLIQEKLLNYVIFNLQNAIQKSFKNEDFGQLTIWKATTTDNEINIKIPLREITSAPNYIKVKKALEQLAGIVVKIPTDRETIKITGLLAAEVPKTPNYRSIIDIYIRRSVAKWLIEIDKDLSGKPIHWTYFMYQVTQNSSCKYTAKIYKKLCSWRQKGGFTISLEQFREWLCIENKYKSFSDIKKNILIPVQHDLTDKADLWFNCKAKYFVRKQNNVKYLNFKIITHELQESEDKLKDHIIYLLKTHFKFQSRNIEQIRPIFDYAVPSTIINKINDLYQYYQSNSNQISNITGYVIKSLFSEFCTYKLL